MKTDVEIFEAARTAFEAGFVAEARRILADLPPTGAPWEAHLLSGAAARADNDYPAALHSLAKAAREAPEPRLAANAWAETARVYGAMADMSRARAALDHAVRLNPDLATAWVERAALELGEHDLKLAESCLDRAHAMGHESARYEELRAEVDVAYRRYESANARYRRACEMDPRSLTALVGLANVATMQGDLDEAKAALEKVFAQAPQYPAHRQYASLQHFERRDEPRLKRWLDAIESPQMEALDRMEQEDLLFACAKALEDLGDYAQSFEFLQRANDLHRASLDYDVEAGLERRRAAWPALSGRLLEAARRVGGKAGVGEFRPIFIVGLPRSGTTLLEQMLSGHSRIQTIGETGFLAQLIKLLLELDDQADGKVDEAQLDVWLAGLRQRYFDEALKYSSSGFKDCIVDKSLENFWHAGIAKALFPQGIVIAMQRDPMDCCFGCYRQLFGRSIEYSYRFDELAAYYRGFKERMADWEKSLPGQLTDLHYEQLIEAPRNVLEKLLSQVGLSYEDACLDYSGGRRFIPTLSQVQLREPLNRSGMGRWKHYAEQLAPLYARLEDFELRYAATRSEEAQNNPPDRPAE